MMAPSHALPHPCLQSKPPLPLSVFISCIQTWQPAATVNANENPKLHHLHGTLEIYIYTRNTNLPARCSALQYSTATLIPRDKCNLQWRPSVFSTNNAPGALEWSTPLGPGFASSVQRVLHTHIQQLTKPSETACMPASPARTYCGTWPCRTPSKLSKGHQSQSGEPHGLNC